MPAQVAQVSQVSDEDPRRRLPSVDRLLVTEPLAAAGAAQGHALAVEAARAVLARAREQALLGDPLPSEAELAEDAARWLAITARGTLHPVINATGVIIHTNLGRAPLSDAARQAMEAVAAGYSNLEYDLEAGERGSRYLHAEQLLCRLTGAEAALVVNNNAGAVFLVLTALARGREVIISRGQLVEIGGGFRIPDVLRQSGANLVEVGTTNRTHLSDFRDAISPETALLLRVHSSNFKQIGFTAEVSLADMVALAHGVGLPVVDDLGSGTLLDTARYGLSAEPTVQDSVAAGADLVTFSGDKLLGGPQAGLIVGRAEPDRRAAPAPADPGAARGQEHAGGVAGHPAALRARRGGARGARLADDRDAAGGAGGPGGRSRRRLESRGHPRNGRSGNLDCRRRLAARRDAAHVGRRGGHRRARCAGRRAAPRRSAGGRPDRGRTTAARSPHRAAGDGRSAAAGGAGGVGDE